MREPACPLGADAVLTFIKPARVAHEVTAFLELLDAAPMPMPRAYFTKARGQVGNS